MITVIYDDHCPMCRRMRAIIRRLDWLNVVDFADISDWSTLARKFPSLDRERCLQAMHLIDEQGRIFAGFPAFRRLMAAIPPGWALFPLLYLPGVSAVGDWTYKRVVGSRKREEECCLWHG